MWRRLSPYLPKAGLMTMIGDDDDDDDDDEDKTMLAGGCGDGQVQKQV